MPLSRSGGIRGVSARIQVVAWLQKRPRTKSIHPIPREIELAMKDDWKANSKFRRLKVFVIMALMVALSFGLSMLVMVFASP
jgi:hypothetical protein